MECEIFKQNKILVLGGYGGNNVGDDAQLAGALVDLRASIPEATIIVLTPDLDQTARRHEIASVGFAPRVSFFDFDEDWQRYTRFGEPANKEWLINRAKHIHQEAERYVTGSSHKLTGKQLTLIKEMQTARLIYYAGGGYMMGPTASRLWDAMLVCMVAKLFNVPVVMSGQNIGVWIRDYDRKCASEGFPYVSLIGTRDDTFSKDALAEIGVTGDHIFATHDDAFFVPVAPLKTTNYILRRIGLSKNRKFISLSFHLAVGALDIIKSIRSVTDLPIVIVPTCPPDQKPQVQIYNEAIAEGIDNLYIVRKLHSHSEVKGLISSAYACVSSRHHPLIFAMGGPTPAISLNFSPYFNAKNFGALKLCGIEDFCIDIADKQLTPDRLNALKEKLNFLLENRQQLTDTLSRSHVKLRAAKERFMRRTRVIWDKNTPES